MIIPLRLMSHLGVAYLFYSFMEFEIWHVFLLSVFEVVNRLRQGKLSRLSYFKHSAGGSLQVKIRGERDGRSDSGPELEEETTKKTLCGQSIHHAHVTATGRDH